VSPSESSILTEQEYKKEVRAIGRIDVYGRQARRGMRMPQKRIAFRQRLGMRKRKKLQPLTLYGSTAEATRR
jgi:hypothetical protein